MRAMPKLSIATLDEVQDSILAIEAWLQEVEPELRVLPGPQLAKVLREATTAVRGLAVLRAADEIRAGIAATDEAVNRIQLGLAPALEAGDLDAVANHTIPSIDVFMASVEAVYSVKH